MVKVGNNFMLYAFYYNQNYFKKLIRNYRKKDWCT